MNKSHLSVLDLLPAQKARIVHIYAGVAAADKLRQLGLRTGELIRFERRAPLDGPCLVTVDGREIAIGNSLCGQIEVELEV